MVKKINNRLLVFLLCFISLAIISAFIIEHKLGHVPCNLCVYERFPYILSFFLILKIIFFKKYEKTILLILFFIFVFSSLLALYHFGIEQGVFNESFACKTKEISTTLSKEELIESFEKNLVSCKDVSFRIFGFSLATINAIFSIILSVIFLRLFINYEKN
tara:strand:+ start:53 stop:535 length:483 start_codon:yes stop_codon:yes gene_type:complete